MGSAKEVRAKLKEECKGFTPTQYANPHGAIEAKKRNGGSIVHIISMGGREKVAP